MAKKLTSTQINSAIKGVGMNVKLAPGALIDLLNVVAQIKGKTPRVYKNRAGALTLSFR
jgi:hypothetical protein